MPTRAEILADSLNVARPLFDRFLAGFDDANRTRQAPGLPNHAAWTLGHLALYHHRAADRLLGHDDPRPLPERDFLSADGRGGNAERFDTESVCYGSSPTDEPAIYPGWLRCVEIHDAAWARLVETVRAGDDAMFDRPVPWGATPFPGSALVTRMLMHLATHGGQITDLRRALGMGSAIR